MCKDEHIIDWILERTSDIRQKTAFRDKKRASSFDKRKVRIDNMIYFCEICNHCWTKVTRNIDIRGWRIYPKGNIPTIGKTRKICLNCDDKKE